MKVWLTLVFSIGIATAFASFSIINSIDFDKIKDKEKGKTKFEKYSLKNIHRPASFFSLSSTSDYSKLSDKTVPLFFPDRLPIINTDDNDTQEDDNSSSDNVLQLNSILRINTGNSIVIYPLNFKVKSAPLGLFKTPTAPTR